MHTCMFTRGVALERLQLTEQQLVQLLGSKPMGKDDPQEKVGFSEVGKEYLSLQEGKALRTQERRRVGPEIRADG